MLNDVKFIGHLPHNLKKCNCIQVAANLNVITFITLIYSASSNKKISCKVGAIYIAARIYFANNMKFMSLSFSVAL